MREDLLHFIWKYRKLQLADLRTSNNESVSIVDSGLHNHLSGPDFFNAKVRIDNQLWAGNVEMHVNASDWFVHHHEKDKKYDNVILHVVWNHDLEIHRKDNSVIPTLVLKKYVNLAQVHRYINLLNAPKKWINCEADFPVISDFNYLIVQATIDDKTYLLDATDNYLSFGEIPFRCLNSYGRLMDFKNCFGIIISVSILARSIGATMPERFSNAFIMLSLSF